MSSGRTRQLTVEGDAPDRVEPSKVVLVRVIPSVPRHDVEWSVVLLGHKEPVVELGNDVPRCRRSTRCGLFKSRPRGLKVSRVGQSIGADGSQFRQLKMTGLVELEYVSSYRTLGEGHAIPDASRHHTDLVGPDEEPPHLGLDVHDAVLRDNEEVSIGRVEGGVLVHVPAGRVDRDADPGLQGDFSRTRNDISGSNPVDTFVDIERIPAELIR